MANEEVISKNTSLSNTTSTNLSYVSFECVWSIFNKVFSLIHFLIANTFILIKTAVLWIISLIKGGGYWIFELLIVTPLSAFYFETILGGLPPHEMCARITAHTEASFWEKNNETILECRGILDRKFRSFEVSVLMSIYFAFFVALLFRIFFCICCSSWKRRK